MQLCEFLGEFYDKIRLLEPSKLENKVVFITGSNGFIGGNILSYLHFLNQKAGLKMRLIAHSFSQRVPWLPQDESVRYLSGDLKDLRVDFDFDFLIHAATYGQPKKVFSHQNATIELNTATYIRLLERAKLCGASVLFLSTSSVYGAIPADKSPAKESFVGQVDCTQVAALYGEAKRLGEVITQIYAQNGVDAKVARIAIAYGPGVKFDDKRFINEFIKKALQNGEITMMDSGSAVRQICFISDMVEMLLSARERVYNVSGLFDAAKGSVASIAKIIAAHTQSKVVFPAQENGVLGAYNSVIIDISKYREEFGKNDFVGIEMGLKKSVEWIKFLKENENGL